MVEHICRMVNYFSGIMKITNIILVGFMGTGKTVVGKKLADKMHRHFVDMDSLIESRAGKSIARIFSEDGEESFRTAERELVKKLARKTNQVIAAGGGVVLNQDNIRQFSQSGIVICLSASMDELHNRLSKSNNRPLLHNTITFAQISQLLKTRQQFYDAIPTQIDTTDLAVDQVVERIMALCQFNHIKKSF